MAHKNKDEKRPSKDDDKKEGLKTVPFMARGSVAYFRAKRKPWILVKGGLVDNFCAFSFVSPVKREDEGGTRGDGGWSTGVNLTA